MKRNSEVTWLKVPLLAPFAVLLLWQTTLRAQSYSIDRFTINGGGGTSTAGVYSVSGTIGQHDASGPVTGGNYSVTGGFWSLFAVQTPGGPLLSIRLSAIDTVAVSWPSPNPGWNLQQNTNVNTTNWTAITTQPLDDGTNKTYIVNPPIGTRFYRLFKAGP